MLLRDLRYAFRHLLLHPGISVAAILSLAIGIGATATTFGWVDQMILRPLPGVRDAGSLFVLFSRSTTGIPGNVSHPDYIDIRASVQSVAEVAATHLAMPTLSASRGGPADRVSVELVSDNYFETLGARMILGRTFQGTEVSVPGAQPVAVLSDGLWRQRFGSDPGVLGKTFFLNNHAFTIVGVMSQKFQGGFVATQTDLWVPLIMQGALVPPGNLLLARERRWLQGLVRLKGNGSAGDLQGRVEAVSRQLTKEYASIQRGRAFFVTPLWQSPVGIQPLLRPVLVALAGLAGLLLLLAGTNVANLLLARALQRRRELAIRLALGAGRRRAVSQFVAEGLLLATAGGVGGVLLARWAIGLLRLFQPPTPFPGGIDVAVDRTIVLFSGLLVLVVGSLIGLIPAVQSLRSAPMSVLRTESEFVTAAKGRRRLGDFLAALQVAVCVTVLIGGGLSLRSLDRARRIDLGFRPENILLADYDLFPQGYSDDAGIAFHQRLLQRMTATPGVSSASIASRVPFGFAGQTIIPIEVEGYMPRPNEDMLLRSNVVGPLYFRTMAIPLVRGREFEERDDKRSALVAIVSQAVAKRYWPNEDPLGKRLRLPTGERLEVIGVAADVRYEPQSSEPQLFFYLPMLQWYRPLMTLQVRTTPPGGNTPDVRRAFLDLDPGVPLFNVTMLSTQVESATFLQRFAASLSVVLALVCLALTAIGVYSLLAYAVAERTTEIGVRVALGAQKHDIVGLVLRHASLVTAMGLGLGILGGLMTGFLLRSLLVGVDPTDAVTWIAGTLTVAAVVMLAGGVAITRATRIGPLITIRRGTTI